jgi:hypothetical protein
VRRAKVPVRLTYLLELGFGILDSRVCVLLLSPSSTQRKLALLLVHGCALVSEPSSMSQISNNRTHVHPAREVFDNILGVRIQLLGVDDNLKLIVDKARTAIVEG